MSVDFNSDYSNHSLLDNQAHYDKIYALTEVEASEVHKGDLLLLRMPCGQYKLVMATADSDENVLHVTKYAATDFVKADDTDTDGLVISATGPCGC